MDEFGNVDWIGIDESPFFDGFKDSADSSFDDFQEAELE